jgi:hypothetical protein
VKEKQGLQMVNCREPEISDLFPFYLNGDVTPDETRKIEGHVSGCAACEKKLSFFMALSKQGLPAWRRADEAAGPGRVQFRR